MTAPLEAAVDIRWTRATTAAAVAVLTLALVFVATLLLRPDPQDTAAVPAPRAAPADGPSTDPDAGSGADADPDGDAGADADADGRTVDVGTGGGDATAGDSPAPDLPAAEESEQDAAALAAATAFLGDVAGMTPVPGPVTRDGDRAEVTVYSRGEDGRVVQGITTVVSLRRDGDSWSPTGARTPTIAVDAPAAGATVTSPLTVTGRAHAYEGTVTVTVVEDRPGSHTIVGEGFVTGAGDRMGPFAGEIEVVEHNSERGWVAFTESSAVDGSTVRATIVPVAFADEMRPGP